MRREKLSKLYIQFVTVRVQNTKYLKIIIIIKQMFEFTFHTGN